MLRFLRYSFVIAAMLLCALSSTFFSHVCGVLVVGDADASFAGTCSEYVIGPLDLPLTSEHDAVASAPLLVAVIVLLSTFTIVSTAPKVLGRVNFLERRDRLLWLWASAFPFGVMQRMHLPQFSARVGG